jgi:Dyp-type peroxidase family
MVVEEPLLAIDDIQGDSIAGFRKDHVTLVFLQFAPNRIADVKQWLLAFTPSLATARQVADFNTVFRSMKAQLVSEPAALSALWRNIGFTSAGLLKLVGKTEVAKFADTSFVSGAEKLSSTTGDPTDGSPGDPRNWLIGAGSKVPDAMVVIAADRVADRDSAVQALLDDVGGFCAQLPFVQHGDTRPAPWTGHEHFGFKDGISQPGVRGKRADGSYFTPRFLTEGDPSAPYLAAPGQPLIWPGEILLNLPKQKGGNADPLEHRTVVDGPDWTTNGSYLVFRRLRQDVGAFIAMINAVVTALQRDASFATVSNTQVQSMLVGRFQSGCPIMRAPDDDAQIARDPYASNNFLYAGDTPDYAIVPNQSTVQPDPFAPAKADPNGVRCPLSAHVRKVNSRDQSTDVGTGRNTLQHRIIRRGIPYGPEFDPANPDDADRGLLFLAYQASIPNQFEFLMRDWVNNDGAPQDPSGFDPLLSPRGKRQILFTRPDLSTISVPLPADALVTTTGAAYLFVPTISTIKSVLAA